MLISSRRIPLSEGRATIQHNSRMQNTSVLCESVVLRWKLYLCLFIFKYELETALCILVLI
jgi:hypothetical protein